MSSDYPSDWKKRRKAVLKRDGFQCQNCGSKEGPDGSSQLHAHHIVPKSKGGTHRQSNLTTLCEDCHNSIHGESLAPTATKDTSHGESYDEIDGVLIDRDSGKVVPHFSGKDSNESEYDE
ncbi:HNH endonuclease [Halorubrum ezzemoulense]|uniref:HNH endonuclease n=1 Tax=Halorubrum ezzemoulense TaxID=337243 RepID=UPI00233006F2|nr:HNH endonuclease [Halorubrum ezzemoulense]MDB2275873.1 HNH endonuclease [Halorubrum ezzemoulense]